MRILYASEDYVYNYWPLGMTGDDGVGRIESGRLDSTGHDFSTLNWRRGRLGLLNRDILGEKGFSKVLVYIELAIALSVTSYNIY